MNKVIVSMLIIIVIIMGMITAVVLMKPKSEDNNVGNIAKIEENINNDSNEITTNNINNETIKETNTNEEKISPNAFITYKIKYKKCGHETTEYREIPKELVNLTKIELQEKYNDWNIEEFSDTNIILKKESKDSCDEHFILKDKDGIVTVFKKDENGEEKEYEVTDISTEYLTDTDKINIKNGIEVNGIQNLNQLIEDFE